MGRAERLLFGSQFLFDMVDTELSSEFNITIGNQMLVAYPSKLGHILDDTPPLLDYSAGSGEFIKYKGRSYCCVEISQEGQILLTKKMMDFLKVRPGMELLSIRSSDIAFTMGAKGPLLEKAKISHALYHIVSVYFLEVCQATWHL